MRRFLPFFIFLIFAAAIFSYFNNLLLPVNSDNSVKVFVINQGDGLGQISRRLEENLIIRDRRAFILYTYLTGVGRRLQAGTFRLKSSLSTPQVAENLSKGGSHDYWLKILEGWRNEEIANHLADLSPLDSQEFLAKTRDLQGYIFPDSYLIPQNHSLDQILSQISQNFTDKFSQSRSETINIDLSDREMVTLASIIEREARTIESKKMVAGILLNRIKIGMALQADATVQYARDSQLPHPQSYWQPLDKKDLSINSAYNTYLNPGLPPGPICNPGADSLYAAYHPYQTDYLYYITGNDNQMHYAKTFEEHNSNIARYLK